MRFKNEQLQEFMKAKDAHMKVSYRVNLPCNYHDTDLSLWSKDKEARSIPKNKEKGN